MRLTRMHLTRTHPIRMDPTRIQQTGTHLILMRPARIQQTRMHPTQATITKLDSSGRGYAMAAYPLSRVLLDLRIDKGEWKQVRWRE